MGPVEDLRFEDVARLARWCGRVQEAGKHVQFTKDNRPPLPVPYHATRTLSYEVAKTCLTILEADLDEMELAEAAGERKEDDDGNQD